MSEIKTPEDEGTVRIDPETPPEKMFFEPIKGEDQPVPEDPGEDQNLLDTNEIAETAYRHCHDVQKKLNLDPLSIFGSSWTDLEEAERSFFTDSVTDILETQADPNPVNWARRAYTAECVKLLRNNVRPKLAYGDHEGDSFLAAPWDVSQPEYRLPWLLYRENVKLLLTVWARY